MTRHDRLSLSHFPQDFHEMSLKRHIKDVHFRNQNTYVICPQCCKQYASQNSLYSHLNRVHGVKKDMLQDMQLQMVQATTTQQNNSGAGSAAGGQPQAASAPPDNNGSSSSSSAVKKSSESRVESSRMPLTLGIIHK